MADWIAVRENKQLLLEIANEVEKLVVNQANRKVFERYSREFHKKLAAHQKTRRQFSSGDRTYPGLRLIPVSLGGVPPENKKEQLERDYILLTIIHDWLLRDAVPISKDPWPLSLAGCVGCLDFKITDEERLIIETSLGYVKADLKPAETEQKNICAKIKAWFWKLYEKTLKAFFDAVLEKLWPK